MPRIQPPTLLVLIGLGFLVVALPLVAAIVTAIVQVDSLSRDSHKALVSVQQNASISRALADRARELERAARQYQALADPAYKDLYYQHRGEVEAMLQRLMTVNEHSELRASLDRARQSEARANEIFERIGHGRTDENLEAAFSALRDDVLVIVQELNAKARDLSNAMPEKADTLQGLLMSQAALVIPLSLGLAVVFSLLVSRSVGQINSGIRLLGRGMLREPIQVKGTRDLEELGQRLDWLRVRLLELEAQNAEFLRNVSHELKTPLTNIREGTRLLLDDNGNSADPAERLAITRILESNSIRLQQLIEQLLRYGADSAFKPDPGYEVVHFDRIVAEAIDKMNVAQAARQTKLKSWLAPAMVRGNAKRLRVIVDNLLSNAIKYAPSGGEVDVVLDSSDGMVLLDVRDNGPGVSDQDAPHVFDWFYTGTQPADSVIGGTGMGLAIAQEYAQQHDGHIVLLPSAAGAHFRLTLREQADDEA